MHSPDLEDSAANQPGGLYPSIEPFAQRTLAVDAGHVVYVEQCGQPDGAPVVVLHGGPASGASPMQRRFFDPAVHRIVLFDQRGSGRSTPAGGIEGNDTAGLIRDIESIRTQLNIERWLVFGGSWGASLGIAYAAAHRERCRGLLLRGAFLTGDADLDWFFGGAGTLMPEAWERLARSVDCDLAPERPGSGLAVMQALAERLLANEGGEEGRDADRAAVAAATAWKDWEDALSIGWRGGGASTAPVPPSGAPSDPSALPALVPKYRIQAHYLRHRCWLGEAELLQMATQLERLPTRILHGRLDWICRPQNAVALHRAIGGSVLEWVDGASHSPFDSPMAEAIVRAVRTLHRDAD